MKMKTITFLSVVAGLLLHVTFSHGQGTHEAVPFGSTNAPYGFYEYLPTDYNTSGEGSPLLIFLHGAGERGNGESGLGDAIKFGPGREIENGRHFPFVILSPQTSDTWNVSELDDLIRYALNKYNIDEDRIYLTGLSMGAMGLVDYLEEHPGKIAAVVPIAGSGEPEKACTYSNVPLWAFHGDRDDVVPISGSEAIVAAYNDCSPTPEPKARLTVLEGKAHWGWNEVYDGSLGHDIYSWFLQFSTGDSDEPEPNNPPTVSAGKDKAISLPTNSLTLEGSASDAEGEISGYEWEKISGPSVAMEGSQSATLSLQNLQEGTYEFRLTATDNEGASGSDEVKVQVHPEVKENKAPLANAGSDKTVQLPLEELTLRGSAEDEDGSLRKFEWKKLSGPSVQMSGKGTANLKLQNLQEGSYTFRFTATDNQGASDSDEVAVRVMAAEEDDGKDGDEEREVVVDAGSDFTLQLPVDQYQLSGKATLVNCRIRTYQWTKVSGPKISMKDAATANLVISDLKAGEYIFRFTATAATGESDSDEVKLRVEGAALPDGTVQGLSYAYYEINRKKPWSYLPDFNNFTPKKTGTVPSFSLQPRERNNHFAFVFTGFIKIDVAGTYFFYTLSDDGSKVYLNDELVVNNDGIHPEEVSYNRVELEEGYQKIRIEFFENTGFERLYVSYKGPGIELQELPRAKLYTVPSAQENRGIASSQSGGASDLRLETEPTAEVSLYPNPAKRFLNLHLGELAQVEALTVTIMDLSGRKVFRKEQSASPGNASLQLDLDAMRLERGTYLLLVQDKGQEQVRSFRFVKN